MLGYMCGLVTGFASAGHVNVKSGRLAGEHVSHVDTFPIVLRDRQELVTCRGFDARSRNSKATTSILPDSFAPPFLLCRRNECFDETSRRVLQRLSLAEG